MIEFQLDLISLCIGFVVGVIVYFIILKIFRSRNKHFAGLREEIQAGHEGLKRANETLIKFAKVLTEAEKNANRQIG